MLIAVHWQRRLKFALQYRNWTSMFIDESRFQLWPDDHRRYVWRRPGQRADPDFTFACHTGPQLEVMVWGAIPFDSRTPFGHD
ncbi:transposable element Tc1 transposase [Trichonephila clavipes]|uniref:Transposable element Tc1 transposase n=1 Tax=Trichonephila clavipes TaxID=2585209 RepID=A0A8X6VS63_TRICX|nr:transposable element Tc1 transposase [Trichonephila clavipes]